ncbi:MAG: c-type cytochrome [Acidobacteria bacterium]|nr:c-type cytochrome [Acidobacteriota bacterium]
MRTYTQTKRTLLCFGTGLLALWAAACGGGSVMDSTSPKTTASPVATASEAPVANTPAPVALASATPLTLALPAGETVMTTAKGTLRENGIGTNSGVPTQDTSTSKLRHVDDFPVELKAATKATPQPDAFAPRPTPAVEMVNGKIKQQWQAPPEALALKNPLKATPENITKGREWYGQRCVDCHGSSGKGNGYLGAALRRDGQLMFPTNLVSQVVQANTDGELFWKITHGRSPMPSNRVRFEEEQRWQMVLYLRTLK